MSMSVRFNPYVQPASQIMRQLILFLGGASYERNPFDTDTETNLLEALPFEGGQLRTAHYKGIHFCTFDAKFQ